ncbi:MAG: DUF1549 domain-containing protein [Planctomycetaceae bacterium]
MNVLVRWQAIGLAVTLLLLAERTCGADDKVSYGRDIQPILARTCLACHGPDEESRQADLRLDARDAAIASAAIVPGDADASELIRRIGSSDPDERMPPPEAKQQLSPAERALLRDWIDAGADYEPHWSFVPPVRTEVPRLQVGEPASDAGWARNPIDVFLLERMHSVGLRPSPEADRHTLIRRVSLDLTGLPPTADEIAGFLRDDAPGAYERLVDRLLASPHYGERWGRAWLDLARYSDTNGYEKDRPRTVWPWRDWVIDALNDDMPFDQFTIEQLAGDMLPAAGESQRIATGFHRNTMLNEEGGIAPLEFRYYAMVDRVATTGTVWLGLTTGCAQCHSHKYDPISHEDYYRLMALLNNADEPDLFVDDAGVRREQDRLMGSIAELEEKLPEHYPVPQPAGRKLRLTARHLPTRRRLVWRSTSPSPRGSMGSVRRRCRGQLCGRRGCRPTCPDWNCWRMAQSSARETSRSATSSC